MQCNMATLTKKNGKLLNGPKQFDLKPESALNLTVEA